MLSSTLPVDILDSGTSTLGVGMYMRTCVQPHRSNPLETPTRTYQPEPVQGLALRSQFSAFALKLVLWLCTFPLVSVCNVWNARNVQILVTGGGGPNCVHATTEELPSAVGQKYLPCLAYLCLCIAMLNRKVAGYGQSLSSLETFSPWVGRVKAVRTHCRNFPVGYVYYRRQQ